ncbi:hypothetical protein CHARACLAT_027409 [Characodon lateralis]|uniref:Uncharacterized protein n=1 Tax=Characodon lateralis TaxID=208331 RepID=A0ABU7CU17_9TELE|nr:hypothetical protein [Characodon lateralis]
MLDLWETDKLNSLHRNRLSPSCFNKEEEQGEEAEALQDQPKLRFNISLVDTFGSLALDVALRTMKKW